MSSSDGTNIAKKPHIHWGFCQDSPGYAHDYTEPRRPAVDANRCPWSATGAALQRAGPPDDDHAGRRAAWCGAADAVHRHPADDPAVATILTTAHDIHRITVAFSSGRISHTTVAFAGASLAVLRQNAS